MTNIQRDLGSIVKIALDDEEKYSSIRLQIAKKIEGRTKNVSDPDFILRRHVWDSVSPFFRDGHKRSFLVFHILRSLPSCDEGERNYLYSLLHLLYEGIPLTLANAYECFDVNVFSGALSKNEISSIKEAFHLRFPNFKHARDSIAHSGARNFGFSKTGEIPTDSDKIQIRQYIRIDGLNIILKNPKGEDIRFGINPENFDFLYKDMLRIVS